MKHAKKLLCLLLVFTMAFTLLVACKKDEEPGTNPSTGDIATTEINLAEYTMIRNIKGGSAVNIAAKAFADAAKADLGSDFALKRDNEIEASADAKEILIGLTNRDESTQSQNALGDKFAYSIRVVGNKITVTGATNELIIKALTFLQENYLTKMQDGKMQVPTDHTVELEYHELVKDGKSKYKVIYTEADGGTENFASVRTIKAALDAYVPDGVDFEEDFLSEEEEHDLTKKLILVGNTNHPHSKELAKDLGLFSWVMESKDNQVYLCAFEASALNAMGNEFSERIANGVLLSTADAQKKTVRICKIEKTAGNNEKWNTPVPLFTGGTADAFLQIEEGFYRMRYTKTDKAAFDAYVAKLASDGFQLYASNSMDNNVFNTYYKGDVMLHTYYLHNQKSVSLVMASASKAPKYDLSAYSDGTNVANANLVLMDMNYDKNGDGTIDFKAGDHNNGMGFLYTMSDGSYVVVDGGHSDDAKDLYEYMVANNKREDGNILIRAWILTHPDGDHWGCLVNFANSYGPRDTERPSVILENFVAQYHYNSYQSGSIKGTVDNIKNAMRNFGNYTRVVPLLGQSMYFGEAKFTFLGTSELPTSLKFSTNEQSLIMNVEFEGKKVLMMGDAVGVMANSSNQIFDEAFRADFLQAAHHGLNPSKIDNKTKATAVIFCTDSNGMIANNRRAGYQGLLSKPDVKELIAEGGYQIIVP